MTRTNFAPTLTLGLRRLSAACLLSLLSLSAAAQISNLPAGAHAAPDQAAKPASPLALDPAPGSKVAAELHPVTGMTLATPPANFHQMPTTHLGELSGIEKLTIRFSATARLGKITSTPDFPIEQGSSCVEGNVYESGSTCTLLVRFTPRGAGNRFGRVAIENSTAASVSAKPFYVGLGGNSYAPVVSFTPAVISTVASSKVGSAGLLSNSNSLSVDGGDTLYVADTGNNVIRSMDASGKFVTVSSGTLSAPYSVVADSFGDIFFDETTANLMFEIFVYGSQLQVSGVGTDSCTVAAPCQMPNEQLYSPGQMSIDPNNQVFFTERSQGAGEFVTLPYAPKFSRISDPFSFQNPPQGTLAVDAYDNIYSLWVTSGICQIASQYFSDAANGRGVYRKVAGGKTCGFSGDGGPARNAEIGTKIPQFAFDVAGNMYFADSDNQRVRRIDYATGNITTIAGTGTAGYGGDGGASTLAYLANPSGVAVDSQGQVYVISGTSSTSTTQLIRKLGPDGALPFSNQTKGTASAASTVTMANTGNSPLTLTSYNISGAAAADFAIDPNTTTCLLTPGSTLANGQSCKVGIIFTPTAAGTRSATLTFLDNSVTGYNRIQLYGTSPAATAGTASVNFITPASGASYTTAQTVPVSISVTGSGATPTGTVKFTVSGAAYGSPVTLSSSGTASVNLTGLTAGTRTIAAVYSGDANYATVTATRSVIITAAPAKVAKASVAVVAKTSPATTCKSLVYGATVSSTSLATGVVQLKEGSTVLSTATLSNGAATISTKPLSAGTHNLTASYGGDATHAPAAFGLKQTVTASTTPCTTPTAGPVHVTTRPRP